VFVSDLGLRDEFVGVCHLVIARIAPDVRVVDLSHGVPPHDIQAGAMMLANGMTHAGPYAVALAIVDPEIGPRERAKKAHETEALIARKLLRRHVGDATRAAPCASEEARRR